MKKIFTGIFLSLSLFIATAAAQTTAVHITGGRFLINVGQEGSQNARIETANFTAVSFLGGYYSPWYHICWDDSNGCSFGKILVVPPSRVYVGGCIGDCFQFNRGPFTLNGTTYENAYYRGQFDFSRTEFQIPRVVRNKGSMTFRKPFSMSGHLQVCQETNIDRACPADKILFDGDIEGAGLLTVTGDIRIYDNGTTRKPYLNRKVFDYQFEQ